MKQTSFMIEVVMIDQTPTIIVRANNGAIVKIMNEPSEMASFLESIVTTLTSPANV